MPTFPNIVVAVDFSETSIEALRFACDAARQQNAQLHILHVVPDARLEPWALEASGFDLDQLNRDAVADAQRQMTDVPSYGLPAERVTRTIVLGATNRDITRYAREHDARLLVVGTHGYGPVRRFLLGSVATRVLRSAPCPVVTVPPRSVRMGQDAPAVA
jgi:nucleotide-binding universal stress UspA family protein